MALTVSATDTEARKPVNVIYQQMLLENARPLCPYFLGTQPGTIQRNGGSATVNWRRWSTDADPAATAGTQISPTTTALAELTGNWATMGGRTPNTASFTDVTATVAKYGQFYILNEEVDVFLPNGTMAGITRTLGISAGRSLNQLQRNTAEDSLTQVLQGGVASDGAIVAVLTAGTVSQAVNTLARYSAMPFSPMSPGSTNVGSTPLLPAFWGICHPDVAYDVSRFTGFKSVETYAGNVQTVPGEFGAYGTGGYTVRFVQTPDAVIDTDSGGTNGGTTRGTSDTDLYSTVIYGEGALGSVGLGETHPDGIYRAGDDVSSIELIAKGRGSYGAGDPFDEIMTVAWKAWHASAVLNANWGRSLRSGATKAASYS